MKHDQNKLSVFVSYASEDRLAARFISSELVRYGFMPWLDEEQLLPGQDWKLEIEKAVDRTDAVIICLSEISTTKRGFVQKEIKKALDIADQQPEGAIFLIPVRLEPCQVPKSIQRIQRVDLFANDGMQRLIKALQERAEEIGINTSSRDIKQELDGEYIARGNNPDGSTYRGKVIIVQHGNSYKVIWHIGGNHFQAEGFKLGSKFVVRGDFNFQYEIDGYGILRGEWENGASEKLAKIIKKK